MIISATLVLPFSANAQIEEGTLGENITYQFDSSTGDLSVIGRGAMTDYDWEESPFAHRKNIRNIFISEDITSIGNCAFMDTSVEVINLPKSVTRIGSGAFWGCDSIKAVNYFSTYEDWEKVDVLSDNSFDGDQMYYFLKGRCGDYIAYCLDLQTGTLTINGRGGMYNYDDDRKKSPFADCEEILSIVIDNGVTTIGSYAFNYCTRVESVEISNSVTSIGESAFEFCYGMKSINLGSGVTSIGYRAFEGCTKLNDAKYAGTKETWKTINIEKRNECLTDLLCEHVAGAPVNEDYQKATCQQPGGHDVVVYCSICNAEMDREFKKTAPKTDHVYQTVTTAATLSKNGSKYKKCKNCNQQSEKSTIYYPKTIRLEASIFTYDGKAKKPKVIVKDSRGRLIASSHYTLTYPSGRKDIGKYTVEVKFGKTKDYTGTKKLSFTINPKGTKLSSLSTPSKKKIKVKWKTQTTKTTGYQIQLATDKNFSKNVKTVTVEGNKKNTKTVTDLKNKTKYYVRIRTYKTNSGKKFYSDWSGYKTITTKK